MLPYATEENINKFLRPLNNAMEFFNIRTPEQIAAFIAQIAHESGSLKYVREIASGEAYDTGRLAKNLGNTPEKDGDGQKYKGRGLIQITGLTNYKQVSKALSYDFVTFPEHLEKPSAAAYSAAWFWKSRNLNAYANGSLEGFKKITKRINGGYNGLEDRLRHWKRCRETLNLI